MKTWKLGRDSLSKCLAYFKDGNTRTFYSLDWTHKHAPKLNKDLGLNRLRKLIKSWGIKAKVAIIYNNQNGEEIECYKEGIQYTRPTMKTLKELNKQLNKTLKFNEKYPQYDQNDHKVHVLIISPCLNETDYYRMILPAMELNKTDSHSAIITAIQKWDFNKQFDDYDSPIDLRLIEWADYVVLPALFTNVDYIIDNFREINDDIQFIMDTDANYFEIPSYHPDYSKVNEQAKEKHLENISKIDLLTAPNTFILNYYQEIIKEREQEYLLYFEKYPNLLSQFTLEEIPEIKRNNTEKVRIGIILDASQAEDLRTMEQAIKQLAEKYKDNIEIIIIGWSKKIAEQHQLLKDIEITFQKPVSFTDYHQNLNELTLDIGLLPLVNNSYNASGKAFNRYLDYSALKIPTIACNILPFKNIITEGENGMIAASQEDWITKTEQLIHNPELRKAIGNAAFQTVWEKFSYNAKAIQRLKNVFL